jgi:hypothetical protein
MCGFVPDVPGLGAASALLPAHATGLPAALRTDCGHGGLSRHRPGGRSCPHVVLLAGLRWYNGRFVSDQSDKPPIGDVGGILSRFGISSDFAQKVRFRGPVGKLALVGVICLVGLSGVGIRSSSSTIEALCAVLATVVVLSLVGAILWYSHAHPDQATLEGMEVVLLYQQKAWATKGLEAPKNAPVIPNPAGIAPQLNPPEDPDQ